AELWVRPPLGSTQPAHRDDAGGIKPADEGHVLSGRIDYAQHDKDVRVARGRRNEELGGGRPGDFGVLSKRLAAERQSIAKRLEVRASILFGCIGAQGHSVRVQEQSRPAGARQWPVLLRPAFEAAIHMPHVQLYGRLLRPASVSGGEEVAKE